MTNALIIIGFILTFLIIILIVIKKNYQIEKSSQTYNIASSILSGRNLKEEGKATFQDIDKAIGGIGQFVGTVMKTS